MGKSGFRAPRVCSTRGKYEGPNWKDHWTTKHSNEYTKELAIGECPLNPLDNCYERLPIDINNGCAASNSGLFILRIATLEPELTRPCESTTKTIDLDGFDAITLKQLENTDANILD